MRQGPYHDDRKLSPLDKNPALGRFLIRNKKQQADAGGNCVS